MDDFNNSTNKVENELKDFSAAEAFKDMAISPEIIKALDSIGIKTPTEIQSKAMAPLINGMDIIARAPTGTGKTFAFGIPLIECLNTDVKNIQSVIICPTRELCIQIGEDLKKLVKFRSNIKIEVIYGGVPIIRQINALKKHPHIIVATPGRILDHIGRGTAWLGGCYTLIFDEADEMFKMGFIDDVRKIINKTPKDTQIGMFSATLSREVMDISWQYQNNPIEITVEAEGDSRPNISQFNMISVGGQRLEALTSIIDKMGFKRIMVFCNMKSTTERVCTRLKKMGLSVKALNGDIPQVKRNIIMKSFRDGKYDVLVATDVAARGIDIDDVDVVFNYDIPDQNEYYLHRIGRTGRAQRKGVAITFSSEADSFRMRDIRKYTDSDISDVVLDKSGEYVLKDGTALKEICNA